jgi:hypothetical protein
MNYFLYSPVLSFPLPLFNQQTKEILLSPDEGIEDNEDLLDFIATALFAPGCCIKNQSGGIITLEDFAAMVKA